MSLTIRKSIVFSVLVGTLLLANLGAIAGWLERVGVISWAQRFREEYLTGTAITVIIALLVLLTPPAVGCVIRRCRVCDALQLRRGRYCPSCGSRARKPQE